MLSEKLENNTYIIRIERGELLMASLSKFMKDIKAGSAYFYALGGGLEEIKCSFSSSKAVYETDSIPKKFSGPMELAGAVGNIAWSSDKPDTPMVHCHVTLADKELKAFGAHLSEAKVNLTTEIFLTASNKKIFRGEDESTKLQLLKLSPRAN